jgi:hypothetical protein
VSKDGNTYARIYSFSSASYNAPYGGLMEGPDGALYGSARSYGTGGANEGGLFKIRKDGTGYVVLHTFLRLSLGYGADGARPNGGLVLGSDGAFYGTTQRGGDLLNAGIVFKLFSPRQPSMAISPAEGGSCRVSMTGIAHPRYRVDASSNLTQWVTVTNLPNPTGTVEIQDAVGTAGARRFYRGVFMP